MGYWRIVVPNCIFRWMLPHYIKKAQKLDRECLDRVSYYNKLQSQYEFDRRHLSLIKYTIKIKPKAYFFDVYRLIRYFSNRYKIWPLFGDIIGIPEAPAIVKSRPISDNNMNSVLLKLNSIRHFLFIKDPFDFYAKKDKLVWRGNIQSNQTNRILFLNKYIDAHFCNLGQVNKPETGGAFLRPKLSILEQLEYKFVLCLEGNDVATNLKWVMSSNSLAVMPKPRYETWFMEGKLIPDYHYVCIKDDFSDLEEKLNYYLDHEEEALGIIKNAHLYIEKFKDYKQEKLISLLVLEKYFRLQPIEQ